MAALVQIMAWHQPGYKPLFEPVMGKFGDAYMRLSASMSQATIVQTCILILPCWNHLSIHLPLTHYQSLFKIALLSQLCIIAFFEICDDSSILIAWISNQSM